MARSAGTAEYTDLTLQRGKTPPMKQSDNEHPVILVASDRVHSMGQLKVNSIHAILNCLK